MDTLQVLGPTKFPDYRGVLIFAFTVKPVYYGYLGTSQKCPNHQSIVISRPVYIKCPGYTGAFIFKCPVDRFHYKPSKGYLVSGIDCLESQCVHFFFQK